MEVELARFGRRASLGAKADITVIGPKVEPIHAVLVAQADGSVWLYPEAVVWLERQGTRQRVSAPVQLFDSDIIVIGQRRCIYRNLLARREVGARKRRISWFR